MEPDEKHLANEIKERQRKKNIKEYQGRFFKNLSKKHNKGGRKK